MHPVSDGRVSTGVEFCDSACGRGERALDLGFEESEALIVRNMDSVGMVFGRRVARGLPERSAHAIRNIRALCDTHLAERFHLDVVDVHESAALVSHEGVLASPALVREQPLPVRILVGDLLDPARILAALDVQPSAVPGSAAE